MDKIRSLIVKGKIEEALDVLERQKPQLHILIDQLRTQWDKLQRESRMGILSRDNENTERNQITAKILDLASQKDAPSVQDKTSPIPPKTIITSPTEKKTIQKILFLAANPTNEARIQSDKEHRIIKQEMGRGLHRDTFTFLPSQFALTVTELLRAMNAEPNIVHFSGHGLEQGILITTSDNKAQLMPTKALKRLFKSHVDNCKLVILNSCYSAEQAEAISSFGMYVIGNNLPIKDSAAINFSKGFYNGLGEGKSIEKAFNDAMIVVETENPNSEHIIEVWKAGKKLDI